MRRGIEAGRQIRFALLGANVPDYQRPGERRLDGKPQLPFSVKFHSERRRTIFSSPSNIFTDCGEKFESFFSRPA
jgi:hypothetical protein